MLSIVMDRKEESIYNIRDVGVMEREKTKNQTKLATLKSEISEENFRKELSKSNLSKQNGMMKNVVIQPLP